ncbi:MAG: tail fiber domain-containing protein [Vicingaceae bacterium]|nr:MAG: tail fiber domain-containing protein [Vicingaceae bacterium]
MITTPTKTWFTAIAILYTNALFGQFNTGGIPTDRWGQTDDPGGLINDIRRGGMGNFTNFGTAPGAAFHINENYLTDLTPNAINYYLPGEVFRTTGPAANVNAWRMFTGAGNGTERFSITVPANSNNTVLQTQQANSRMLFNTNGAINRMLIVDGSIAPTAGRIAMGNNLPNNFAPQARLHLHQTDLVNTIRFTTDNMLGGNGFEIGYDASSNVQNQQYAEIHNRENTAIKFFTNGNTQRMHINQSRQSAINGYTVSTAGYVGVGGNGMNIWGSNTAIGVGPFSLLHLNDATGNLAAEERGYRPWMKTGLSFTSNKDFSYIGYRAFTSDNTANGNMVLNRNELNIVWSNNQVSGLQDSDDMCFRFTNRVDVPGAQPNTINTTDLTSPHDLDGLHIARFTALGNMGLGPTFGEDHPIYVKPQSLLHMSRNDSLDTWLQITNQFGTGQTAADGLRMGITTSGTAHIRQQEDLPLIFYTGSIEDARIIPSSASTLPGNHGMMGIGNWTTPFNIANPMDAKLDIDGDLRIRTVTEDTTLLQVLVIDSTDHNRVHWRSISTFPGGSFGTCLAPTVFNGNSGAANLNNTDNFHFLGNNSGSLTVDNVMIGATSCVTPSAKLHVLQNANAPSSIGILAENNDVSSTTNPTVGIKSILPTDPTCSGIAAWLEAPSANMAVCQPYALFVPHNGGRISINYPYNDPAAIPWMLALNGAANSPVGWFNLSDQAFKTKLDTISNPLEKIKNINGVYFEFDTLNYPNYHFPSGKQIGFIAQNVDTILPEAVSDNGGPLSMDYAKITPLLLEAVKSLTKKVETLETQLNQCCQNNNYQNNGVNNNHPQNNELGNTIKVELSHGDAIVLE